MALIIKATQKVDLSVVAKDREGNPAGVENGVFSVSDPAVGEITEVSPDGLACVFLAGSPIEGQINFSADPVGESTTPLLATLDVTVVPGDAEIVEISAGAPSDQ